MIYIKEFVCECGRVFYGSQSFNGHRSHCKAHLGEEKYSLSVERQKSALTYAKDAIHQKSKDFHNKKEAQLQKWIEEQHRCEHCGIVMTEFYGSGRFCSRSCANSKEHTQESKMKTSASLKGRSPTNKNTATFDFTQYVDGTREQYLNGQIRRKNLKYYTLDKIEGIDFICCPYCNNRMSQIQARHVSLHGKTMKDLYEEFGKDFKTVCDSSHKKKSLSSKETQTKLIEEGRHKGWRSRKIKSYAEQFWENVLIDNNIEYDDEYPINKRDLGINSSSCYFLDFLLPGKIDLEIDGKQHTYPDRKEHDEERDRILLKNGFIIYRIPWINPVEDNKEKVKQQIDDFLKWYQKIIYKEDLTMENVV